MRALRLLYLGIGIGLLVLVFREIDPAAVWDQLARVGAVGLVVVVSVHFASFLGDTAGWQLTLDAVRLTPAWLGRLFVLRLVGEAFNYVTPLAGMGGEPVKAVLLKRRFDVSYRESGASLLLAKTINLLALVVFLAGALALLAGDERLPAGFTAAAAVGLAALGTGIGLFFAVQRLRLSTVVGHRLARGRVGRRLERALAAVGDVDDRLVRFYAEHGWKFGIALVLGLATWLLGVLEVWFAMRFLGHPVSLADAWILEGAAQLVRTGTFFIPAAIGAQEGAFMVITAALTGDPVLGVALALVRRAREAITVVAGLAAGWGALGPQAAGR